MTQESQGDQMTGLCRWAWHFSSVPLGISVSRAADQGCLEGSLDGGTGPGPDSGPAEHPAPARVSGPLRPEAPLLAPLAPPPPSAP